MGLSKMRIQGRIQRSTMNIEEMLTQVDKLVNDKVPCNEAAIILLVASLRIMHGRIDSLEKAVGNLLKE